MDVIECENWLSVVDVEKTNLSNLQSEITCCVEIDIGFRSRVCGVRR